MPCGIWTLDPDEPSEVVRYRINGDEVTLYDAGTFGADNLNPAPRSHVGFRFGGNGN